MTRSPPDDTDLLDDLLGPTNGWEAATATFDWRTIPVTNLATTRGWCPAIHWAQTGEGRYCSRPNQHGGRHHAIKQMSTGQQHIVAVWA